MELAWNKLSLKYRLMALAAGFLAVVGLFYLFLYLPQRQRIAAVAAQYELENRQVAVIENFARLYPQPEKYYAELSQRSTRVNKLLPDNHELGDFLVQAEQAAKAANIQLAQIKPGQIANKNGYREVPVEIIIKGDFFQTMNFIKALEDGTRFNILTSIVMQSRQGLLETKLMVAVYSFGVPANTQAAGPKPQK